MRKRRVSILALAIAGLVTTFLIILSRSITAISEVSTDYGGSTIDLPQSDTAFAGIFYTPHFNDSLPHYLYRRMEDSARKIKIERELENRGVILSGMSMGIFGVYSMDAPRPDPRNDDRVTKELLSKLDSMTEAAGRKIDVTTNKDSIEMIRKQLSDSVTYYNKMDEKRLRAAAETTEKYYYVGLEGYKLDRESKFFVENGTYNLAYVKWDTAKGDPKSNWEHGHYERKTIPVRYAAENERVLVPVNYNQYKALNALVYVCWFAFLFGLIYFVIGIPVQILLNISRGKAFDENNVRYFNLLARAFLVWGALNLFLPYILDLFLRNIVPNEFQRASFKEGLGNTCWIFLLAIAFFIVGKAFQKGNSLQKEQDLTI